jgi:hypothetical protein
MQEILLAKSARREKKFKANRWLLGANYFYEMDFSERSSLLRFCIYGGWAVD